MATEAGALERKLTMKRFVVAMSVSALSLPLAGYRSASKTEASVASPNSPFEIAKGPRIYGPSNDVSAVDLETFTVKSKALVGGSPWGLVVLP
jgi:YVTN family beta-propeller protein